jgi:nitroimidazol reductase NimA-like FMN-containing flavoprotein (pyridoxamine 5'-phosphate oxidase superfamily)
MESHPNVCFEVDVVESLTRWSSVVCHGCFKRLENQSAAAALSLFIDRLRPLVTSSAHHHDLSISPVLPDPNVAIVFAIDLDRKSGKRELR